MNPANPNNKNTKTQQQHKQHTAKQLEKGQYAHLGLLMKARLKYTGLFEAEFDHSAVLGYN